MSDLPEHKGIVAEQDDYIYSPRKYMITKPLSAYITDQYPEGKERWKALDGQVNGDHYKTLPIQPIEFILANELGFCEGNIVKYICRYKKKGGKVDLEKVIHYAQLLMDSLEDK